MELLVSLNVSVPAEVVFFHSDCLKIESKPVCTGATFSFQDSNSRPRLPEHSFPADTELLVAIRIEDHPVSTLITTVSFSIEEVIPLTANLECEDALDVLPGLLYVEGTSPKGFSVNVSKTLPCTEYENDHNAGLVNFFRYTIHGDTRFSTCQHDILNAVSVGARSFISLYTGSCDSLKCLLPLSARDCTPSSGQYIDVMNQAPGTVITIAVYSPKDNRLPLRRAASTEWIHRKHRDQRVPRHCNELPLC